MKNKILSIMMAAAMTISLSAFSTALNINTASTTAYADEVNTLSLNVHGDHIVFPDAAYPGRAVIGETINMNAEAEGGVGNVTYSYSISGRNMMGHGSVSYTDLEYGAIDWTPELTGEYQVNVTATDEAGNTAYAYLHYYITNPLEITSFTGDHQNPNPSDIYGYANAGDTIKFDTDYTGGVGNVTCTYEICARNGQAHPTQTFASEDGSFEWTPSGADLYAVQVTVTDQAGHSTYKSVVYGITE